jgi:uncharacterized protein YbcI
VSLDGSPTEDKERPARSASPLTQISNEMVRLYKEQFGRGPTSARAAWAGADVLTVVLEDTLTPAERNLVKMGEHERLRETRMFFQYASVREFCEPVEALTGRKVRAFISGIDTLVDGLSVETFVLHPAGREEGRSRAQLGGPGSEPGDAAAPR